MNKYKKFLIFSILLILFSCGEDRHYKVYEGNANINDTITLVDGHVYYYIRTHSSIQPIHSQYCKKHNNE